MAAVPKKLKSLLFGMGPKVNAIVATVLEFLGLACLIVGIISGSSRNVGLWSTEWFLIDDCPLDMGVMVVALRLRRSQGLEARACPSPPA